MRVLILPEKSGSDEIRSIDGGVLVQRTPPYQEHWKVITDRDTTPDESAGGSALPGRCVSMPEAIPLSLPIRSVLSELVPVR